MSEQIGHAGNVSIGAGAHRWDPRRNHRYIKAYVSVTGGGPLSPSEARGLSALLLRAADEAEALEERLLLAAQARRDGADLDAANTSQKAQEGSTG